MSERLFIRLEEDPLCGPEADTPAAALHAFAVDAALAPYLSQILLYREALPAAGVMEHVLPDGAVRLAFHFGDRPAAAGAPAEIIGAWSAPARVGLRGKVDGITVTLRAGAAAALLGVPAGEMANTAVALDAVWGAPARDLYAQLAQAASDAARVRVLQAALQRRLCAGGHALDGTAAYAAGLIARSGGALSVPQAARSAGVGERRLQQLFFAHVGLPPRTWSRLARLHACVRALRRPAPVPWAVRAADGGFYDQAHLINEFRALAGMTPEQFVQRAVSASSNTAG
jgi:AraC-like DNA-binding protein